MTPYECEQLQFEIHEALNLHPLYVSGKFNKLLLVMSYDDIRALQAYNKVPYSILQDGRFTIYGVTVKYSPLFESGRFELVEREHPTVQYSDLAVTNCPNCGAPVDPREHTCPYCNTPYRQVATVDHSMVNFVEIKELFDRGILSMNEVRMACGWFSN